jgi:hypothetical protein
MAHLVIVIFFINTELFALIDKPAKNVEEIYHKTIAEKFNEYFVNMWPKSARNISVIPTRQ